MLWAAAEVGLTQLTCPEHGAFVSFDSALSARCPACGWRPPAKKGPRQGKTSARTEKEGLVRRPGDVTDRGAVLRALSEFDGLGRDNFLRKYKFERSRVYFLERNSKEYDSKAILGAAYGYQFGKPLLPSSFPAGEAVTAIILRRLGFVVSARGQIPAVTRESIERALQMAESSPEDLLSTWKQRPASKYEIAWRGQRYPAKAVLALAEHLQTGHPIRQPGDWRGSHRTVAAPLQGLGFEVVTISETALSDPSPLRQTAAPPQAVSPTNVFRRTKIRPGVTDYARQQERNSEIGLAGELAVLEMEYAKLLRASREDLAQLVRHVGDPEDLGDSAGFDILSFEQSGEPLSIEVKTTVSPRKSEPFYMSISERRFFEGHQGSYLLYRVFNFDLEGNTGQFFTLSTQELRAMFSEPTAFLYRPGRSS